jgi:PAS domain S-box-containing protein
MERAHLKPMERKKRKTKIGMSSEELILKAEKWQTPFDAINDAILVLDNDQRVIQANISSEEFFKLPITEMIGKYCRDIVGCNNKPAEGCPCLRSKKSRTRENIELTLGNEWRQVMVDPILDDSGNYIGAVYIFRDITLSKQTGKALRESEYKYHALYEKMLNGCALHEIICDENGKPVNYRYLDVNPAFEKITGHKADELIGKTALDLLPETDPFLIETYGKVALTGKPDTFDFYNKYTDRHFMITAYQPEEGQFASVFQNVTEQKQAEEELRKSEERYKEIVEDTNDLIIKVDHNGLIVFANYMANKIFGLPQEDIIGMHISKCIHPDDKDPTRKVIEATVEKKATSATFENRQISKTGEIRHLFWTSNFHYDSKGNLTEVTSIARDITMRRKMEEELKKAHNELEKRVRERTQELQKANEDLQQKTTNLEELNTVLKILLDRREKDKEENGEKILLNVKELLIPYVNKLKNGPLNENQKNYIELVESGLQEIISPFAQRLTSRYMHITPRELQVGNLVKDGKTSKEIAEILHTTERTVVAHRANLRNKLGLDKKSNLRTYLLSLR